MVRSTTCPSCAAAIPADALICPECGSARFAGADDGASPLGGQWTRLIATLSAGLAPRYELVRLIGYGGMAGVYLARDTRLDRFVAVKVMAPGLMSDADFVGRFRQEARTTARLNHPNIVAIHNVDVLDGLYYFIMRYVRGPTLRQIMAAHNRGLPLRAVLHWLAQVGGALDYAHRSGIIHRDVKPGNILVDAEGNAFVTDFGIAKVGDAGQRTRTGMLVGTPAYMSPEQCLGDRPLTGASDQYSLGILAFQMLTGTVPFSGAAPYVIAQQLERTPPSVRTLRHDCPSELAKAVSRMLKKIPAQRFVTLGAALAAMDAEILAPDDPWRTNLPELVHAAGDGGPMDGRDSAVAGGSSQDHRVRTTIVLAVLVLLLGACGAALFWPAAMPWAHGRTAIGAKGTHVPTLSGSSSDKGRFDVGSPPGQGHSAKASEAHPAALIPVDTLASSGSISPGNPARPIGADIGPADALADRPAADRQVRDLVAKLCERLGQHDVHAATRLAGPASVSAASQLTALVRGQVFVGLTCNVVQVDFRRDGAAVVHLTMSFLPGSARPIPAPRYYLARFDRRPSGWSLVDFRTDTGN